MKDEMKFSNFLEQAIASDLVLVKNYEESGLSVLKYRQNVFYDDLWDSTLEDCRGLVFDMKTKELVSYPFTKIYNYGIEKNCIAVDDDEVVTAFEKINGFMIAATWHNGEILWSTTGSLNSDFIGYAKEIAKPFIEFLTQVLESNSRYTYLFECVSPKDPHIIPTAPGLYFLGRREKYIGSPIEHSFNLQSLQNLPENSQFYFVIGFKRPFKKIKELAKSAKHEGFVIYTDAGDSFKIKSPYYLFNKMMARGNINKLLSPGAKQRIPEEFYPVYDSITKSEESREKFFAMDEQSRLAFIKEIFARPLN